eukprot:4798850-Pleurochrysis_carterae.AAC.1
MDWRAQESPRACARLRARSCAHAWALSASEHARTCSRPVRTVKPQATRERRMKERVRRARCFVQRRRSARGVITQWTASIECAPRTAIARAACPLEACHNRRKA